jgi:lactate dehydrogenase-like 2-hydroxyacid dehydrogenase
MLGNDVHNKILGLLGFGKIGIVLAKRVIGLIWKYYIIKEIYKVQI